MPSWGRRQFVIGLAVGIANVGGVPQSAGQQTITPKAKELNKAFDAEASQWIERFEHEGRGIYDKRYEILDAMHLKPGMKAADIGAGGGLFARLMAQRVAPGGTVYAVDISKRMIDHIEKTARDIPTLKPTASPVWHRSSTSSIESEGGKGASVRITMWTRYVVAKRAFRPRSFLDGDKPELMLAVASWASVMRCLTPEFAPSSLRWP